MKIQILRSSAWLVFLFSFSVAAFANGFEQICEQKRERRIEIADLNLPCAVKVKKSEDGFLEDQTLWNAQHEKGYCEKKFEEHLKNLARLGWTCSDGTCVTGAERRVKINWANSQTQLPCEVVVTRSEEKFLKTNRFWWAHHQKSFCIEKYQAYLSQLKKQGWICQEKVLVTESPKQETKQETKVPSAVESIPNPSGPWGFVETRLGLHFDRMDASDRNGGSAVISSRWLNPTVEVSLNKSLTRSWSASLFGAGTHTRLQVNNTVDRLLGSDGFLFQFGVGTQWKSQSDWVTGLEAGFSQQLFLIRTAVTTLSLEKLWVPEVSVFTQYSLLKTNKRQFGPELRLGYLFSAQNQNVRASSGHFYCLGLWGEFDDLGLPMKASLYFQRRFQNTSVLDWNAKELGIQIATDFDLV